MGYYLHDIPGRLRIKIPGLKRNTENAWEIQEVLKNLSGVSSIAVNIVTGSVVVNYDPEFVSSTAILTCLSREGYIDLAKAIAGQESGGETLGSVGRVASKALLGFALDRALQGSPLSILTAFI
jgi:copper chaperone CopZ